MQIQTCELIPSEHSETETAFLRSTLEQLTQCNCRPPVNNTAMLPANGVDLMSGMALATGVCSLKYSKYTGG